VQIGGACDLTDLGLGDVREWEESLVEAGLCDGRKVICLVFRQIACAHELWAVILWVMGLACVMTSGKEFSAFW